MTAPLRANRIDAASDTALSISSVERDTGLSKDVLRVWERRYAFPQPSRDAKGERLYPLDQVERLRTIKRLMDAGHRPGKLLALTDVALANLDKQQASTRSASQLDERVQHIMTLLRANDDVGLRQTLSQLLMKQGLQDFVMQTVAALNREVGEAWIRGDLQIYQEHVFTQMVQSVLRAAINGIAHRQSSPCVLLTTFPNESHGLGLLLVEALLAPEGAQCISLGPETPVQQIAAAAIAYRVDVVALSFSSAYSIKQAHAGLRSLRELLPQHVRIWAGGAMVSRLRVDPNNVTVVSSLSGTLDVLKQWREARAATTDGRSAP